METARKHDLIFNPEKTHVKASAVKFFGCLYDQSGVHPDPEKVEAIHAMTAPGTVSQLQEFLGMLTYLSPFIPGLGINPDSPPEESIEERHQIHMGSEVRYCVSAGQGCHHQRHKPTIL